MGMGFAPTWLRQVSPPPLHKTTLTTAEHAFNGPNKAADEESVVSPNTLRRCRCWCQIVRYIQTTMTAGGGLV